MLFGLRCSTFSRQVRMSSGSSTRPASQSQACSLRSSASTTCASSARASSRRPVIAALMPCSSSVSVMVRFLHCVRHRQHMTLCIVPQPNHDSYAPLVTLCLLFRCYLIDKGAAFLDLRIIRRGLDGPIEHGAGFFGLLQLGICQAERMQVVRLIRLFAHCHFPFLGLHIPHTAILIG